MPVADPVLVSPLHGSAQKTDSERRLPMNSRYIVPSLTFLIFLFADSLTQSSPARSITDLTELIKQNPVDANAYFDRGQIYLEEGDYDNAILDFTEAVALKPDFAEAYLKRGQAYHDKRDYKKAVADFTKLVKLKPNDAHAYALRGQAYLKKGSYYRAVFDFTDAIVLKPDYADAYAGRGRAYQVRNNKGDEDCAFADFNKAIELNPNRADAYAGRGRSYLFMGEHDKAIADLTQGIQLEPDDFSTLLAYQFRALAYASKGDMKSAAADRAKAEALGNARKNKDGKKLKMQLPTITILILFSCAS